MTDSRQPTVTIVGAGMAGLAAALHLAERGYQVTIYEKELTAGGNLAAADYTFPTGTSHPVSLEVFPHMYAEWYVNFFEIAGKLDLHKDDGKNNGDFQPCTKFGFVERGEGHVLTHVVNDGSPATFLQNLVSGAERTQDMFLADYAVLDILTQDFSKGGLEDEKSLNGFLASRSYATPRMLKIFQNTMLYIWTINSYNTAVHAFQSFARYQLGSPTPSNWTLRGSSYEKIIKPLVKLLQTPRSSSSPVKFIFDSNVCGVTVFEGKVQKIRVTSSDHPDSPEVVGVENLILAIPPSALGPLMTIPADGDSLRRFDQVAEKPVVAYVPNLSQTRHLDAGPLPVLYVPLRRTFNFISPYYVSLEDSPAVLTYIELPYLRKELDAAMVVAISISDVSAIPAWQGKGPVDGPAGPADNNYEIARQVLAEFIQYVPDEYQDRFRSSIIDDRLYLKANDTAELFLNTVGSRQSKMSTCYPKLPNLFFATGANDNPVGIETVERAVLGGLLAAQALCKRNSYSQGNAIPPVNPLTPPQYDRRMLLALKISLSPWAFVAKCWADVGDLCEANAPDLMVRIDRLVKPLWIVSLTPGAIAWQYWTEISPPKAKSLQEPGKRVSQITGDISDLVDTALKLATVPAWWGIQAVWLVTNTLWWRKR